jgi:hypothetical protein
MARDSAFLDSLTYQITHIFLPPKLPNGEDDFNDGESHENDISHAVLDSLKSFRQLVEIPRLPELDACIRLAEDMLLARPSGSGLLADKLCLNLVNLKDTGDYISISAVTSNGESEADRMTGALAIHVRAQNAGILATRHDNEIIFEAFELLATNKRVMSCKGSLLRQFPLVAVSVKRDIVADPDFLHAFTDAIVQLDSKTGQISRSKVRKAGKNIGEERDTVDPVLVTEMLTAVLRGVGGRDVSVVSIHKRSREEARWSKRMQFCWHRSALWMLLRVVLRLILDRATHNHTNTDIDTPKSLYKPFLVFHMAELLHKANDAQFPSDVLSAMSSKICRRIHKLSVGKTTPWLDSIAKAIQTTHALLDQRWAEAQQFNVRRSSFSQLASLDPKSDSVLRLGLLDDYLTSTRSKPFPSPAYSSPGQSHHLVRHEHGTLPASIKSDGSSPDELDLVEFEAWVAAHLQPWVTNTMGYNQDFTATVQQLNRLINAYWATANRVYSGNPEALSRACLVILELWVACDTLAVSQIPLMRHYGVGFPPGTLDSLLTPELSQMKRLQNVENYLNERKSQSRHKCPSMFEGFGSKSSFAVQFLDGSQSLQALLTQVQEQQAASRREKVVELTSKKAYHQTLIDEYNQIAHDEKWVNCRDGRSRQVCRRDCSKCKAHHDATNMRIDVFEDLLPKNTSKAKAVIFELNPPSVIRAWRDVTLELLKDIFVNLKQTPAFADIYWLSNYEPLAPFCSNSGGASKGRLQPGSEAKPFIRAHYRDMLVSEATSDKVCRPHGSQYEYLDTRDNSSISSNFDQWVIPSNCSFASLSKTAALRDWIGQPTHTSNEVIAQQHNCPINMSLEEFRAFGHLRAGVCIQWQNILCQTMMPSLNFSSDETCFLVLQAIYEAGPRRNKSVLGTVHQIVDDPKFAEQLLEGLKLGLEMFKENWESASAFCVLLRLCTRLLSVSSNTIIQEQCIKYLATLRRLSFGWARKLCEKVDEASGEDERRDLSEVALFMALICHGTFDIGPLHLESVLSTPKEAFFLIAAAVICREYSRLGVQGRSPMSKILRQGMQRLSHQTEEILSLQLAPLRNSSLDEVVKFFWSAYTPGCSWAPKFTTKAQRHVLETYSRSREGQRALPVSFNLLTGNLLVNGTPLSSLPDEYLEHPTFRLLFGKHAPKVVISNVEGMQFSGTRKHHGWDIHFSLRGSHLIVKAVQDGEEGGEYEFIPPAVLQNDFPVHFTRDFRHWLDCKKSHIEFRSLDQCWKLSDQHWVLRTIRAQCALGGDGDAAEPEKTHWVLQKDGSMLLGLRSRTATALSSILQPLESPVNINCVYHDGVVIVELPRFQLTFRHTVGIRALQSKNYDGMLVDEKQMFGSLVGLKNLLVLRSDTSFDDTQNSQPPRRTVLIPQGKITYSGHETSQVSIDYAASDTVSHHAFQIDDLLGRLVDTGAIRSKLYLAYLHALTAFCLPDPLTGRTGTEESLQILNSPAVKSFERLDNGILEILGLIARVSPMRTYYPAHLTEMERVVWSNMPALSQHDAFYESVNSILRHGADCEIFFPTPLDRIDCGPLTHSSNALVERAMIHNSVFRISGFGAERAEKKYDDLYIGRRTTHHVWERRTHRATLAVRLLVQDQAKAIERFPSALDLEALILKNIGDEVEGPSSVTGQPLEDLRFHLDWLGPLRSTIGRQWCRLHEQLSRRTDSGRDKYKLSLIFAALEFSEDAEFHWPVIQMLLVFATLREKGRFPPPTFDMFQFSFGNEFSPSKVISTAKDHKKALDQCPESLLPAWPHESHWETENRRVDGYDTQIDDVARRLSVHLEQQWPCHQPQMPPDTSFSTYLKMNVLRPAIDQMFDRWWRNYKFHEYIRNLANSAKDFPLVNQEPMPKAPIGEVLVTRCSDACRGYVTLDDLLQNSPPDFDTPHAVTVDSLVTHPNRVGSSTESTALSPRSKVPVKKGMNDLLTDLLTDLDSMASREHEKGYVVELRGSLGATADRGAPDWPHGAVQDLRAPLLENVDHCHERVQAMETDIRQALTSAVAGIYLSRFGKHLPRIAPILLLEQLSRHRWPHVPETWKRCLITYALSLTHLQRERRLLSAQTWNDLVKEFENVGHANWDPIQHPESLLLEVESGLLIREVQEEIASQMRSPPEGSSAVMQLNMGEGKSSVIVPIVAAALANTSRLVRIIVAKPQSKQMSQMTRAKLGGLLNRQIFYLPFSRSQILTLQDAVRVRAMCARCMKEGGVMLVQPEQLLSFKLMGLESIYAGRTELGCILLSTQNWFDEVCRDIVDESDENFNVKFELVYTMGSQIPVDLSPQRWTITQNLLGITAEIARKLHEDEPTSIQYENKHVGGVPHIRLLTPSAGELLVTTIAEYVCNYGVEGCPVHRQSQGFKEAVMVYLTRQDAPTDIVEVVEDEGNGFFSDFTSGPLLLLRGLLAGGVLNLTLSQKRWRVDYGRTYRWQRQTLLAVPFRAKDSPAPRSEFSHPDVVIVLTCLTYYYEGLSNDELDIALERLGRSDQPEFDLWVRDAPGLEPAFRQLCGINLRDREQCEKRIYPAIRFSKAAIDFYLSKVVFSQHMREFPSKLSASGWDLARHKAHPVTGFSGTCDSKYLLPLTITHLDLPEQRHTNASVLKCLLQPENQVKELNYVVSEANSASLSEFLIQSVIEDSSTIRVILDVGAQMLELDNLQVATAWLKQTSEITAQAVIFFNNEDELSILTRNGLVESLLTSPYSHQLGKCLVFLDEAHTRGTDLKLPENYRAAVTLGPKLTKDRLVQGSSSAFKALYSSI